MAWTIRSLDELSSRARGYFRQYLPGTDTSLKNNFVTVVVKVLAGLGHELELRAGWLARQIFLYSAADQFVIQHCADVGIYRKQPAAAVGLITGTGTPGAVYPAGVRFVSASAIYVSTAAATAGGDGSVSFAVSAETKGADGNRDAGGAVSLADPGLYPDLSPSFTVSSAGLGGGADLESIDDLRQRGLQRKRNPPGAGTLTDYERYTREVSGVLKAWAFRAASPGTIWVYFLFANRVNLIPEPSDVAVVQAYIDTKRLIRVDNTVALAPIANPIDVTINGLSSDTAEIRAGISAAITAMFLAKCRPGIPGNTFTVSKSWIGEAISGVTGEDRHVLALPVGDVTLTDGRFPTLGTVTYGS